MNQKEYVDAIASSMNKGLDLIKKKSSDYGEESNPFKNFDNVEGVCNISSEKGILVRMSDKMTRIGNLLDRDAEVKDESIEDTLLDLANYSYILLQKIRSKK